MQAKIIFRVLFFPAGGPGRRAYLLFPSRLYSPRAPMQAKKGGGPERERIRVFSRKNFQKKYLTRAGRALNICCSSCIRRKNRQAARREGFLSLLFVVVFVVTAVAGRGFFRKAAVGETEGKDTRERRLPLQGVFVQARVVYPCFSQSVLYCRWRGRGMRTCCVVLVMAALGAALYGGGHGVKKAARAWERAEEKWLRTQVEHLGRGAGLKVAWKGTGEPRVTFGRKSLRRRKWTYRVEVTSDRAEYLEGMTARFVVRVSRRKGERELPFKMKGKYLYATFPDGETAVDLTRVSDTEWTYDARLEGTGEQTLRVELRRDLRKAIEAVRELIARIERRIEYLRAQLEEAPAWRKKLIRRRIAVLEKLAAALRAAVASMEKPLAVGSCTITVHERPAIAVRSPSAGAYVRGTVSVAVSSTATLAGAASLLVDGRVVSSRDVPPGDFSFAWDTTGWADGVHMLSARLELAAFDFRTEADAVSVTVDNTAPAITDLWPEDGAELETVRPLLRGAWWDGTSGIEVGSARVFLDGEDVTVRAEITEGGFSFRPTGDLAEGWHGVEVTVADRAGNRATGAATWKIAIPPAAPRDVAVESGDGILRVSWSPNTEPDLAGYMVYHAGEGEGFGDGRWTGDTGCEIRGLTNGMAYRVRVTAVDTWGNESEGSEAAGVPVRVMREVGIAVRGAAAGEEGVYAGGEWMHLWRGVLFAWREVLGGARHVLRYDGAEVMSLTVEKPGEGKIEVVTATSMEPGEHVVEAEIRGNDGSVRRAVRRISAAAVSGGCYYRRKETWPAPWSDFPLETITVADADGDVVIVDKGTGETYARIEGGGAAFDGGGLVVGAFSGSGLVLVSKAHAALCWRLDFSANRLYRVEGEEVTVAGKVDEVVVKEGKR